MTYSYIRLVRVLFHLNSNGAEPPEKPHIETLYYTSKVPNRYNSLSYQEQW